MPIFCFVCLFLKVNAALASNLKTTKITVQTFVNLGNATSSLTVSQITSVSTPVLIDSLSILASVTTWSQDKATTIVQAITTSGYSVGAVL